MLPYLPPRRAVRATKEHQGVTQTRATRRATHNRPRQTIGAACTAVPRIRSIWGVNCSRFAAVLVGLVFLLTAAPVHARADDDKGYLALGASFPFGFDPRVTDRSDPDVFVGYPETLAEMLDLDVVNASCPGETTASFISLAINSVCTSYRAQFPLHVDYTTSQLDFAITHLRKHRETRLVTIEVGNNDLVLFTQGCAKEPDPATCIREGLPNLLAAIDSNLKTIFARIRGEAHYRGSLVMVNLRVLDYRDVTGVARREAVNRVISSATLAAGGRVADIFGAFQTAAQVFDGDTCAAGLLIRLTPTTCDGHTSPAGRDLYARTVRAVVTNSDEDKQD